MKPWLLLPAPLSHSLSQPILKMLGALLAPRDYLWQPLKWRGLTFHNRLGVSGGIDKNGDLVKTWWALGAGFVEVGTVTPQPQGPNAGSILKRDIASRALWNKMGFPNQGLANLKSRLEALAKPHHTPIFVNIGKNRETPNAAAAADYLQGLRELRAHADVFVVNISSPNTSGLRELLQPENLGRFLEPLVQESRDGQPLLLKLSPDMDDATLKSALDVSAAAGVDGWVLTNTTLAREAGSRFPAEGGVSGQPLAARAKDILRVAVEHLGGRRAGKLLVSVGGVMSADDISERLALGADLVQVYTALVFEGPGFFRRVARHMTKGS